MQAIQKGTISSMEGNLDHNGDKTTARIFPNTSDGIVTRPLVIPWWLRGKMGNLTPGTEVVYVVFEDGTGLILSRMDGEWSGDIPGSVSVDGDAKINGVSFSSHTHTYESRETSGPH